ncbi:hypothetical protein [Rheinheimera sp. UJ63]|uniref:hypothetical protein n=1 Tax=Rheinheimera sp. UJ63 TaxID=2910157 RepID=UPI001F46C227|nr:hypothetical protein [Rheinheimera sp. UJ63]MCF4010541.1 hypothetical protein [Rheinheimera sp. UJ63]
MHRTTSERLKRIQQFLGVEPDGVLGGQTLSALEKRLLPIDVRLGQATNTTATPPAITQGLTLSKKGIDLIIQHEISSEQYYQAKLIHPSWPGGDSGITIGIGYDLGYASTAQFERDWSALLPTYDIAKLRRVCGSKAASAKRLLSSVQTLVIPLSAAKHVFVHASLPLYASKTQLTFPGVEKLHPDAQSALLSLVYNRGTSISGDSRREMAAIQPLVLRYAYQDIAQQIINMKRLWQGRGLDGLLHRRDDEARLVMQAARSYQADELVQVA